MKDISSVEASHSHLHLGRGIKLLQRYARLLIDNYKVILGLWNPLRLCWPFLFVILNIENGFKI